MDRRKCDEFTLSIPIFFFCAGHSVRDEKWEHFGAYQKAIEEGDVIPMQYLKCYLVGIPGVGKTTTMKRLVKMPLDGSFCGSTTVNCIPMKATEKSCHEHIQDRCRLKVQQDYVAVDDTECVMTLANNEIEDAIELYYWTDRFKMYGTHQHSMNLPANISPNVGDGSSSESLAPDSNSLTENDTRPSAALSQEHPVPLKKRVVPDDIRKTVRYFEKQLEEKGGSLSVSKGVRLMLMVDVGGQSAFLEMLPLLMKGPSLYMTFFKLSESEDPFGVQYSDEFRMNQGTTYHKDQLSVWTVGDVVIQILSSVALSRYPSKEVKNLMEKLAKYSHVTPAASFSPSKVCPIPASEQVYHEHQAKAFLIGTFKDKLKESLHGDEEELEHKLEEIDGKIQHKIGEVFERSMKKKIIAYRSLGGPAKNEKHTRLTFSLDKFSGDDAEEMKELRGRLMEEIKGIENFKIPVRWLIFGLILRKEYEWITIEDCEYLAEELHIEKEDVKEVLIFLSSITGMLLYQPDIDDRCLRNVVLCNVQSIFTSIAKQILDGAYCDEERTPYNEYVGELALGKFCCKRAEHSEKCILEESMRLQDQELQTIPRSSLLSFLSHHHIIARTSESDGTIEYIMPAALDFCYKPEDVIVKLKKDYPCDPPNSKLPRPLIIKFNIGFPPPGLFSCLITTLYKNTQEDMQELVKRNFICFEKSGAMIALVACSRWYEVHIINYDSESVNGLHQLCVLVKDAVLIPIREVIKDLGFSEQSVPCQLKLHIKCRRREDRPEHFIELVEDESKDYIRCKSCRFNIKDCYWIPAYVSYNFLCG